MTSKGGTAVSSPSKASVDINHKRTTANMVTVTATAVTPSKKAAAPLAASVKPSTAAVPSSSSSSSSSRKITKKEKEEVTSDENDDGSEEDEEEDEEGDEDDTSKKSKRSKRQLSDEEEDFLQGEPLDLLSADLVPADPSTPDRKPKEDWKVNEATMRVISQTKGITRYVSVNGPYRRGKSTLLTFMGKMLKVMKLAPASDGTKKNKKSTSSKGSMFSAPALKIGTTQHACTHGLTIWSVPYVARDPKTQEAVSIFLIDAEGSGAGTALDGHDNIIFSVSAMCFNSFLFYADGAVEENNIDSLKSIVDMCNMLEKHRQKSLASAAGEGEGRQPGEGTASVAADSVISAAQGIQIPLFLWVARNFNVKLTDDKTGSPITENQYLENALRSNTPSAEKNRLRDELRRACPNRMLITLPFPNKDTQDINTIATINPKDLHPNYYAKLKVLRKVLQTSVPAKVVNGRSLDAAPVWCEYFRMILRCVQDGVIPDSCSASNALSQISCMTAANRAMQECWTKEATGGKIKLYKQLPERFEKALVTMRAKAVSFYTADPGAYGGAVLQGQTQLLDQIAASEKSLRERHHDYLHGLIKQELDKVAAAIPKMEQARDLVQHVQTVKKRVFTELFGTDLELSLSSSSANTAGGLSLPTLYCEEIEERWPQWVSALDQKLEARLKKQADRVAKAETAAKDTVEALVLKTKELAVLEASSKERIEELQQDIVVAKERFTKRDEEAKQQSSADRAKLEALTQSSLEDMAKAAETLDAATKSAQKKLNKVTEEMLILKSSEQEAREQLVAAEKDNKLFEKQLEQCRSEIVAFQNVNGEFFDLKSAHETLMQKHAALAKTHEDLKVQSETDQTAYIKRFKETTETTAKKLATLHQNFETQRGTLEKNLLDALARLEQQTKVQKQHASEWEAKEIALSGELKALRRTSERVAEEAQLQVEQLQRAHTEELDALTQRHLAKFHATNLAHQEKVQELEAASTLAENESKEARREIATLRLQNERLAKNQETSEQKHERKELEQQVQVLNAQRAQLQASAALLTQNLKDKDAALARANAKYDAEHARTVSMQRKHQEELGKRQDTWITNLLQTTSTAASLSPPTQKQSASSLAPAADTPPEGASTESSNKKRKIREGTAVSVATTATTSKLSARKKRDASEEDEDEDEREGE